MSMFVVMWYHKPGSSHGLMFYTPSTSTTTVVTYDSYH